MNYLFLSKEQAAAVSVNLAPFFVGREGEVLLHHADIIGKAVYDNVSIDINNLYDFKADIESLNGASLVGVFDLAGNFLSDNVEDVLQELYTGKANNSHTHVVSNVTGLQAALDAKLPSSSVSAYGLTLVDDVDAATARATLGLGTAATAASTSFQPSNASLTAIADTIFATGLSVYWTSATTVATYTLTPFARTLLAATTAAAARTTLGAGTGNGTVTSVDIIGTTGITPSGGPITGAGSITLTLSTNLQAWSGIAVASKADDSAVVHLANTETITGTKTFSAGCRDSAGNVRFIPNTVQNATYTFVTADAGQGRRKTDTNAYTYTLNTGVFSGGEAFTVINDSTTGNITIAAGAGVTLRLAGTATTGNRTVAPGGLATVYMTTATTAMVSGPGVT